MDTQLGNTKTPLDTVREFIGCQFSVIEKMEESLQEVSRRYLAMTTDRKEREQVMNLCLIAMKMRDDLDRVRKDLNL